MHDQAISAPQAFPPATTQWIILKQILDIV